MRTLTIQIAPATTTERCCLCDASLSPTSKAELTLTDDGAPVCPSCARQYAPTLVALLDLARVARRVGKIRRHILIPPFEALLDLARAAETYTNTECDGRKAA